MSESDWKNVKINANGSILLPLPGCRLERRVKLNILKWGRVVKSKDEYQYKLKFSKMKVVVEFRKKP